MKKLTVLMSMLLAVSVYAENMFSGEIESFTREGEKLVIAGTEYRVTGDTVIIYDGQVVSREFLREGLLIKYAVDFKNTDSKRFIKRIELPKDEAFQKMMQH